MNFDVLNFMDELNRKDILHQAENARTIKDIADSISSGGKLAILNFTKSILHFTIMISKSLNGQKF